MKKFRSFQKPTTNTTSIATSTKQFSISIMAMKTLHFVLGVLLVPVLPPRGPIAVVTGQEFDVKIVGVDTNPVPTHDDAALLYAIERINNNNRPDIIRISHATARHLANSRNPYADVVNRQQQQQQQQRINMQTAQQDNSRYPQYSFNRGGEDGRGVDDNDVLLSGSVMDSTLVSDNRLTSADHSSATTASKTYHYKFSYLRAALKNPNRTYEASQEVCSFFRLTGVAAIFGPQQATLDRHVASVCRSVRMPHIQVDWRIAPARSATSPPSSSAEPSPTSVMLTTGSDHVGGITVSGWYHQPLIMERTQAPSPPSLFEAGGSNARQQQRRGPSSPFVWQEELQDRHFDDAVYAGDSSSLELFSSPSAATSLAMLHDLPRRRAVHDANSAPLMSVNFFPDDRLIAMALKNITDHWHWVDKGFALMYQHNDALVRLGEYFRGTAFRSFTVRQFDFYTIAEVLKEITTKLRINHILLDCDTNIVLDVLNVASEMRILSRPYTHIHITNLDVETLDLTNFHGGQSNITAFRLFDRRRALELAANWSSLYSERYNMALPAPHLTTRNILLYEAFHVFSDAFGRFVERQASRSASSASLFSIHNLFSPGIDCDMSDTLAFRGGEELYSAIVDSAYVAPISGLIQFDRESGTRTTFQLELIDMNKHGMEPSGTWTREQGIVIRLDETQQQKQVKESLRNQTLSVTTLVADPYVIINRTAEALNMTGNALYMGFAIDLLDMIADKLGFNYTVKPAKDGRHGGVDERGNWNGMVRELIDKEADLAVADLTINFKREEVIDFTKPFLTLGISILYKKPEQEAPALFSFLYPLRAEVWSYMLSAFLAVSIMIFILSRFSPYEWYNPHPCNTTAQYVENKFTASNSLWFTIGSLMQQGSDISPQAISTRIVAGIWWFFALIMISSYTANLAAFLTVQRLQAPIQSVDDLAKQSQIRYGALEGGSTAAFLKESKIPTYQTMWGVMESAEPSVFVKSNAQGVERVRKEDYAYLMESTSLEYDVHKDSQCKLTQIGGLLDSKGFGIGMPQGSPYRDIISQAILDLGEQSDLLILKKKWWEPPGGTHCKKEKRTPEKANELGLANVGGVFVVLCVGMIIAIIVAVFEFIWKMRQYSRDDRESLWTEMKLALRFAIRLRGSSRKPALQSPDQHLPRKQQTGKPADHLHRSLPSAEGDGVAVGVLPGGVPGSIGGGTTHQRPSPRKATKDAAPNAATTLLSSNNNNDDKFWPDRPPQYQQQKQVVRPYNNGTSNNYQTAGGVSEPLHRPPSDGARSTLAYYGPAYATQYGTDFGISLADQQHAAAAAAQSSKKNARHADDASPWRRATPADADLQTAPHLPQQIRYNGGTALPPPATVVTNGNGGGKNKNVKFCVTVEDDLNVEAEL